MTKCLLKKFLVLGISLGLFLIVCQISWAGPRIKFDKTKADVGTVVQGATAFYTFEFQNIGDEPLIIKDVKAG